MTEGEPVIGGLHGDARHFFCGRCMSWMFTRIAGFDDFVNLRAPMLDDAAWVVPFVETYTSEKLPWAATAAAHSYPTFPAMEDFAALVAEFAGRGARPRARHRSLTGRAWLARAAVFGPEGQLGAA